MKEILPGVFHWTMSHPKIKIAVSSYYVVESRVLIDPLIPAEGLDWFRQHGEPRDILLTNRHHYRHCAELEQAFGCSIWCNREGLHEFQAGEPVRGFTVGDALPGNIESYEVGSLCPDETALRVPVAEGALALADGVVRDGDGPLVFVPDFLIGEEPEAVKAGLRTAYRRLAEELVFDHLLLAHGEPWIGGGREALRRFAAGEEL